MLGPSLFEAGTESSALHLPIGFVAERAGALYELWASQQKSVSGGDLDAGRDDGNHIVRIAAIRQAHAIGGSLLRNFLISGIRPHDRLKIVSGRKETTFSELGQLNAITVARTQIIKPMSFAFIFR